MLLVFRFCHNNYKTKSINTGKWRSKGADVYCYLSFRLVRRSLGDEIKRLGITGSPFCDKRKSLSPNRNVDPSRSLQVLDNNESDEISPIKKTSLETINENNILECQTNDKKSEDDVIIMEKGLFHQVANFYLYVFSIISIYRSHAAHHFLQKVLMNS